MIRLKKRAAWAPAITRRSKLSVNMNVGRARTLPARTTGRSFTSPNEMPRGTDQVAATASTPYLAGELISTEPPRQRTHALGIRHVNRCSKLANQQGSRVFTVWNARHCGFV